jgi:hypothetical protein
MPGVVVAAPAAAAVLGGFHPVLLAGVVVVAAVSFGPSLVRHRDVAVAGLAVVGLALLSLALQFEESVPETVLSIVGALSMMLAHLRNRALARLT